jgi:RNAse (barnase) inhibitor barstar
MNMIDFLNNPVTYCDDTEFVAYLSNVNGENVLHTKLSEILKFPDYYGDNWNALYDCLRDFSWINKKGIVLVHIDLPKLSDEEFRTYIEVLSDVIQDWKEYEEHYFKVIFPKEAEEIIKKTISVP